LVFGGGFDESGPESRLVVFLVEDKEEMEAGLGPLGVFAVDLVEEFDVDGV
jgi:hypothetical protein